MVLCQIYIRPDDANKYHAVPVNGPCNVRLVQFSLLHSNQIALQCVSDQLKVGYSSERANRGVILSNQAFGFDQSHMDFHWNNVVIPGYLVFQIYDVTNGLPGVPAVHPLDYTLILTFDIENLP